MISTRSSTSVSEEKLNTWKSQMLLFLKGMEEDVDYTSFPDKPAWFDEKKYNEGRRFYFENSLSILVSHFVFLLLGMSIQRFIRVLALTGKSSTPDDAYERYRKTGMFLGQWYHGKDLWDTSSAAHKAVLSVRRMHQAASQMLSEIKPSSIGAPPPISSQEYAENARQTLQSIRMDVAEGIQLVDPEFCDEVLDVDEKTYRVHPIISQFDMGLTELGFTGGMLLCPEYFGVSASTPEDIAGLDNFVFFWRTVAYCLGVRDDYNVCKEDFVRSHEYAVMLSELYVRPLLKRMDPGSLYMADAVALGYQKRFWRFFPTMKVLLFFGSRCPGIDLPLLRVYHSFSWLETCQYAFLKFVFGFLLKYRVTKWCVQGSFRAAVYFFVRRRSNP